MKASAFLPLLNSNADMAQVIRRMSSILARSFVAKGPGSMRAPTEAERKRRGEILFRWFRVMRADLGWSQRRALDTIEEALMCELGGSSYTPPKRDAFVGEVA